LRKIENQTIRAPVDFEPGSDQVMTEPDDDDEPMIEPVRDKNLLEILAGLQPLEPEDEFPDIDTGLPALRDIDL